MDIFQIGQKRPQNLACGENLRTLRETIQKAPRGSEGTQRTLRGVFHGRRREITLVCPPFGGGFIETHTIKKSRL